MRACVRACIKNVCVFVWRVNACMFVHVYVRGVCVFVCVCIQILYVCMFCGYVLKIDTQEASGVTAIQFLNNYPTHRVVRYT